MEDKPDYVIPSAVFKDLWQGVQQLVFPQHCALCRASLTRGPRGQICASCRASISFHTPPFCQLCPRRLDQFSPDGICRSCAHTKPAYDAGWSACLYNDPMRRLLHDFKYNGKTRLRHTFAELFNHFLATYHVPLGRFDFSVPVPLHPARLRERGFNQSELICTLLRDHAGLDFKPQILARTQLTVPQADLGVKERWTNVEHAFRIKSSPMIADKSILIVDDLFTTGATAEAVSRTLKDAGAAYTGILTLAITT